MKLRVHNKIIEKRNSIRQNRLKEQEAIVLSENAENTLSENLLDGSGSLGSSGPLLSEMSLYTAALEQAVYENPSLVEEALRSPEMQSLLSKHKQTLFITIFCSILQGSFLAYVPSSDEGISLITTIFYCRLFLDLLGRPLALLPRPEMFRSIAALRYWTIFRFFMMLFFFVYIALPEEYFFRNDIIVIVFQVQIS